MSPQRADQLGVVNGIPRGGTTGQVLAKNSAGDFDHTWTDEAGVDWAAFDPSEEDLPTLWLSGWFRADGGSGGGADDSGGFTLYPAGAEDADAPAIGFGFSTNGSAFPSTVNYMLSAGPLGLTDYNPYVYYDPAAGGNAGFNMRAKRSAGTRTTAGNLDIDLWCDAVAENSDYAKWELTMAARPASHFWIKADAAKLLEVTGDSKIGFFGAAPVVKPTGVAVTAGGVHAALVTLGLIAA